MIKHIGMLTLKPDIPAARRPAIEEGVRAPVDMVPGLRSVSIGQDLGLEDGDAQLVFASVFETVDAWQGYGSHPAHVAFVRAHIAPALADKAFAQVQEGISW